MVHLPHAVGGVDEGDPREPAGVAVALGVADIQRALDAVLLDDYLEVSPLPCPVIPEQVKSAKQSPSPDTSRKVWM